MSNEMCTFSWFTCILVQKFSFHSLNWVTELNPTFNMFLASKACLPVPSTAKTREWQINKEQAKLNSQCLTVDTGSMTIKAITFRNIRGEKIICIHLDAAKHWVVRRPLAHAVLLVSSVQIWELRPDFIHGQNEWSHCHNTWKTLLGARKQSCG